MFAHLAATGSLANQGTYSGPMSYSWLQTYQLCTSVQSLGQDIMSTTWFGQPSMQVMCAQVIQNKLLALHCTECQVEVGCLLLR